MIQEILEDNSLAEDLLPTQCGFFFGSVEYDEYYFEDLEITIEQCKKIINEHDFENNHLIYYSSW